MRNSYEQTRIRKLQPGETVAAFDCGDSDLNEFILKEATLYREALLAVTYVVEDSESNAVLAYFSLANDRVSLSDFENKTEFNRFRKHRFVNEKRLRSYPAAKICRLVVENSVKGMHLGSYLNALGVLPDRFHSKLFCGRQQDGMPLSDCGRIRRCHSVLP